MESKVITWVLVIAVIAGGLFLWGKHQSNNKCEQQALEAAVLNKDISQVRDTSSRERLQNEYKNRYMQENCQ